MGSTYVAILALAEGFVYPFVVSANWVMRPLQTYRDECVKFSGGLMFGSSLATLVLYPEKTMLREWYLAAMFTFTTSSIIFGTLKRREILQNGIYTFSCALFIGIIAFLSPNFSLEQIYPLVPLMITTALIATISLVPVCRIHFQEFTRTFFEPSTASEDSRSRMTDAGTVDPYSIRSIGYHGTLRSMDSHDRSNPLEFSGMERTYPVLDRFQGDFQLFDVESLDQDVASNISTTSDEPLL